MLGNIIRKFLTETVSKEYGKNKHLYGKLEIETFAEEAVKELNQLLEYKEKCEWLEKENSSLHKNYSKLVSDIAVLGRVEKENKQLKEDALLGKALKYALINECYDVLDLLGLSTDYDQEIKHLKIWYKQQLEKEIIFYEGVNQ